MGLSSGRALFSFSKKIELVKKYKYGLIVYIKDQTPIIYLKKFVQNKKIKNCSNFLWTNKNVIMKYSHYLKYDYITS